MGKISSALGFLIILLFTISGVMLLSNCRNTAGCPTCVNSSKPAYYNKERAREARRMVRHDQKRSATGQGSIFEPTNAESQSKKSKTKPIR
jgi:hypothetical protein